jgi:predicted metalloprotease
MQWRGRRQSGNIQDRRGGGGMMRPAGVGGVGLLIVLIIGMLFGVDLTPLLGPGGPVTTSEAPSGPNVVDDEQEAFVSVVLAETEDVWGQLFANSGIEYTEPQLVLFESATPSACGFAQSAMGPFYCPNDQSVYLDMRFFDVMRERFGTPGEFARAYVIAHEIGHHVQDELGLLAQVNAQRQRSSERDSNALSVRVELQADCYAGIWAYAAQDRLQLTTEDIRSALEIAARIGDDALQRASTGQVVPDSFTHGSSAQRQEWFMRGFETGDPNQCDTFAERGI